MMPSLKVEFNTVRELEKKSFKVFSWGGGVFVAGIVLVFTPLMLLGGLLMAAAAVTVLGGIAWVSMLAKESSRPVFCPYCSSKNDVYSSRRHFDCDICRRPVIVSENGEPIRAMDSGF